MNKEREVSGKIISKDDACNWNLTVGALKDYDHVYVNGIRYVEFQPEQEPVAWMQDSIELYVLEEKNILRGYVIPLYTAPPKREPLSEDAIWDALPENPMGCAAFIRGVKFAEKMHGITGVDDE